MKTIKELKERTDARQLAEYLFGSAGKRAGDAVIYSHPHIEQRTPSFTVYQDGFKDFATGERGSVIDLVMLMTGNDLPAAAQYVEEFIGGSAPIDRKQYSQPAPKVEIAVPGQHWQTAAADAVGSAAAYLYSSAPDAQAALTYLHDVRGLTDATIRSARLGYNPRWTATAISKADGTPAHLAPGIIIPWYADGVLVAVRTRRRIGNLADALHIAPDTDKDGNKPSKYMSLSGSTFGSAPYNGDRLTDATDVWIVEGEFDALITQQHADQAGTAIAVITAGSAAGSIDVATLSSAPRVILATDNDVPGQAARARLTAALAPANLFTATVPSGKDITDFLTLHNGQLADVLATAVPIIKPALDADKGNTPDVQTVNPDLFAYGLPDLICSAIRRCCHQAVAPTLWVWLYAIAAGLIEADQDVDGVTLTDATEQLGFTDPARRRNVLRIFNDGLSEGARSRILVTIPDMATEQSRILDTPSTPEAENETLIVDNLTVGTVSRIRLRSVADIVGVIQQWLPTVITESHYPTEDSYGTNRQGEQYPIELATVATPAPVWFDDRSAVEAVETVTDITARPLTIDPDMTRRIRTAEYRVRNETSYYAAIGTDATVTPMPANFTFSTAREFTAMRWRAIEEADGKARPQWQLALMLGVAKSSLPAYRKLAGLRSEPQIVPAAVNSVHQAEAIRKERKGFIKAIEYTDQDGKTRKTPYDRRVLAAVCERGQEVILHIQTASIQQIATAEQPKPLPRRPAIEKETVKLDPVMELVHKHAGYNAMPAQQSNVPTVSAAPENEPPRTPGHTRQWVRGQILLNMQWRGFTSIANTILNPDGVKVADMYFRDLTYAQAIEVARGRSLIISNEARTEADKSKRYIDKTTAEAVRYGLDPAAIRARMLAKLPAAIRTAVETMYTEPLPAPIVPAPAPAPPTPELLPAARSFLDTEHALEAVNYAEPTHFDADSYGVLLCRSQINAGSSLLMNANIKTPDELLKKLFPFERAAALKSAANYRNYLQECRAIQQANEIASTERTAAWRAQESENHA